MRANQHFPDTRESLVQALAGNGSRAMDLVGRAYRVPVIALLERKWMLQHEDAEDLAHEFFAAAIEKNWLMRYDASRGKFRTFLRSCLIAFAAEQHERANRLKRGGRAQHESLNAETEALESDSVADALFDREWMRSVLQIALDALHDESAENNKEIAFKLFEQYDVVGSEAEFQPTYAELANSFGLPVTQVTNYLAWARRRFREHVLQTVRALTGSEVEYREEVRALLGINV
ncbi:MAG: ECF-type sigma factor [Gemmatimonadaceae bacterium]